MPASLPNTKQVATARTIPFYRDERKPPQTDLVVVEAPLQIKINGAPFTITMRTPGNELELVRGLLLTEGVATPKQTLSIEMTKHPETRQIICASVVLRAGVQQRSFDQVRTFMSTSSCGLCGSKEMPETTCLAPVRPSPLSDDDLSSAVGEAFLFVRPRQTIFEQTGGAHASALFSQRALLMASFEDVGRHNAVDKVIGWSLLNDPSKQGGILTVSGRISYEIVLKAWRAGISVVAGVSAPTSLAVETARQAGIRLFGFCRETAGKEYLGMVR
jgi:FdhD protein